MPAEVVEGQIRLEPVGLQSSSSTFFGFFLLLHVKLDISISRIAFVLTTLKCDNTCAAAL